MQLFRQLLLRATEAVRSRLLALAGPQGREDIQRILANISKGVERETSDKHDAAIAAAQHLVLSMQKKGELNEAALGKFAKAHQYAEMVAAIALLCSAPFDLIERLIHSEQRKVFLVPCKAAGFAWSTVQAVLKCRSPGHVLSEHDIDRAKADYLRLSTVNAQRVLRFWKVRQTTSKPNDPQQPIAASAGGAGSGLGAS